jgi:trehalose-6-phosphate synthase
MNILSYRGPSTAGGVSSALARIIETCGEPRWWYMSGTSIETRTSAFLPAQEVAALPKRVIDGHYAYCNSFIWPILHDMPEHAMFNPRERRMYRQFNTRFAQNIMYSSKLSSPDFFVNDYQLALATGMLAKDKEKNIILFWHVPWPKTVLEEHACYLAEVAQGLLGSGRIGFHTDEYATNFLNFVDKHLPQYEADFAGRKVVARDNSGRQTELLGLPLGLDFRFWLDTARDCTPIYKDLDVRAHIPCKFVLSVDRADYTKGVLERMEAINHYFETNPHRIGKITFVQVCQPTRTGLPAFDNYWQKCWARGQELNRRWQQGNWQPVSWIDKPVPPRVLAWLYSKAEAMLVNPVRDGLNLTAKEFAMCSNNGALILSQGAGVWQELGDRVVPIATLSAEEIAAKIEASLVMPLEDKVLRLREMKRRIAGNSLKTWWRNFESGSRGVQKVVPIPSRASKTGTDLLIAK